MRITTFCAYAVSLALLAEFALGHGGTFNPGTGGGGNSTASGGQGGAATPGGAPTGGTTPGGSSPGGSSGGATPGGGAPVRPGGAAPAPRAGGAAAGRTTGGRSKAKIEQSNLDWDWWWDKNDDRFLNLKARVRAQESASDNADTFLGGLQGGDDVARITVDKIRREIIPTLKRALKDEFYDARAGAVIALGKVGDGTQADLVTDIRELLDDENYSVRESACLALGLLGSKDAIADLQDIMNNTPKGRKLSGETGDVLPRTRSFAAMAIGLIGARHGLDDTVVDDLLKVASSRADNVDLRVGPAFALQVVKSQSAIPRMIEIFKDPEQDQYVRAHIGVALGKVGATMAKDVLVEGLTNKEAFVQYSSAIALGLITTPDDAATVGHLIKNADRASNRATRNFCIMALGEIGGARARGFLLDLVKNGKNQMDLNFAAIALGVDGYKHQEEKAEMGRVLLDVYKKTRSDQAKAPMAIGLGLLDFDPAVPELRTDLDRGGSQTLKGFIALGLGLMDDKDSIPTVQELVKQQSDTDLRKQASIALGLLQDRQAVELLRKVIEDSQQSKGILGAATVALGFVGDRNAIPVLQAFVENKDGKFQDVSRAFATVALGLLGDKDDIPFLTKLHEHSNYLADTNAVREILSIL